MSRFISLHAQARMQQRAVPREVVDCLLDHGRVHHDHHGTTVVIREMKRYFNTYAVVGTDGMLVSVGRRYQKYRRDA